MCAPVEARTTPAVHYLSASFIQKHSHIPAANCARLVLAYGELCFTSEHHSVPYAECLSSKCPEIGTLQKHKSLERKHLTFCYNHSLLTRVQADKRPCTNTHSHTHKEAVVTVFQNISGDRENKVFPRCVLLHGNNGNETKKLLIYLSSLSTSLCCIAPPSKRKLSRSKNYF